MTFKFAILGIIILTALIMLNLQRNNKRLLKLDHERTSNRIIIFSNYSWYVRPKNIQPQGPGPNYFSDNQTNIWIDNNQYLHIKIHKQDKIWRCSQVFLDKSYGYGSYLFNIQKGFQLIDPRTVLGLFTYLDDYHQIDVQLSQWSDPNNLNTQYAIQPAGYQGNTKRFHMINMNLSVIHAFTWSEKQILFQTFYSKTIEQVQSQIGKQSQSERLVKQWVFTGKNIPKASNQKARINLWLYQGKPPINGLEQEIIVKQFKFLTLKDIQK